jgi:hypothetical protein
MPIVKAGLGSLLFALAITLAGDSVVINKQKVWFHFDKSGAYLFTAAHYRHPKALNDAYEQTRALHYLKQAANLGVSNAAFKLFKINQHTSPDIAQVWLKQAVRLEHVEARLVELQQLVEHKRWGLAHDYANRNLETFNALSPSLKPDLHHLISMIQLARETEPVKLISEQLAVHKADVGSLSGISSGGEVERNLPFDENLGPSSLRKNCNLVADVLVSEREALPKVKRLISQFTATSKLSSQVCFNEPSFQPALFSICGVDTAHRIDCNVKKLGLLYQQFMTQQQTSGVASHLLVVANEGEANTRGGLMFIDQFDSPAVLTHEVAHWLNFYDEYQINASQQNVLCPVLKHKRLGNNLIVAHQGESKQALIELYKQPLFPTNTCNGTEYIAYKFIESPSFMEYLDLAISSEYLALINKYSSASIPVSVNFALAYKKSDIEVLDEAGRQFNLKQFVYWLNKAVKLNFLPAKRMLAQHYISIAAYLDADTLLHQAAEGGDATSQVLLGHYYIESNWLKRDLSQAAYWYKSAAEQNDPYGLYFYGKCLENGWGCIQDIELAFLYYQRAMAAGSDLAKQRLQSANE